jgi:hypothetical protein
MKVCISGSRSIRTLPAAALARLEAILVMNAEIEIGDEPLRHRHPVHRVLAERGYPAVRVWHGDCAVSRESKRPQVVTTGQMD